MSESKKNVNSVLKACNLTNYGLEFLNVSDLEVLGGRGGSRGTLSVSE